MAPNCLRVTLLIFVLLLVQSGFPIPIPDVISTKPKYTKQAIERLSQVFRIKNIPVHKAKRTPPQFMVELYDDIATTEGITKSRGPYNSNVIRSFPDRAYRQSMHFYYNVSYIENEEDILAAEFHLFKMRQRFPDKDPSSAKPVHLIQLTIYQVLEPSSINSLDENGLKLLDRRRISAFQHGWEVFNVASAVTSWLKDPSKNYGFLVTAKSVMGDLVNGTQVRFAQRKEHHDSKQPVLIVYTDDIRNKDSSANSVLDKPVNTKLQLKDNVLMSDRRRYIMKPTRTRFQVSFLNEGHRRRIHRLHEKQNSQKPAEQQLQRRSKRSTRRDYSKRRISRPTCQRKDLYVDFDEIGWSGWIISPKGFNAYHCKGECNFPLGQNQKPTNHATVQSIIHALRILGKDDVSKPCCVPNKLYTISLLYFDQDENVILKPYDDMVAASCGCH